MGFCILGGATDPNPAVGQGTPGEACSNDGEQVDCYEGPAGTRDIGACHGGTMLCAEGVWTACDQVLPAEAESCNSADDDCDGEVDEAVELGPCMPQDPGACATGKDMCVEGKVECRPITQATAERCNGADDDCDGEIDNGADEACYTNAEGCVEDAPAHFDCTGSCTWGMRACVDGRLSMVCAGQITPAEERCEGSGATGDENCDGRTNEGCGCLQNDEQECYGGRSGTEGVGTCRAGQQVCMRGAFGACDGEVTPEAETCSNEGEDNDCNGTLDDIPLRGTGCTDRGAPGVCRDGTLRCSGSGGSLSCVTTEPSTETCNREDDDCDGQTDETFDFDDDEANCGECGVECTRTTQECCSGTCAPAGCAMGGGTGGTGGAGGAAGEGAAGQGGAGAAGGGP
jgi:hypothetical protein